MKSEPDLAARVAALERLSGQHVRSGWPRGALRQAGYLLLATLLTLNAWMIWRTLATQAAGRIERHFWVVCHSGATDDERRAAFSELVRAGNREWRSARLVRLNLRGGQFEDVHLDLANMEGCDFTQSTMVRVGLRGADLQMAKLVKVDLSRADLSEAFMRKADLSDSTIRDAYLRSASLEQCDLKNADFQGSDLTEVLLLMAVLTKANLQNANLSWADLDAADLSGANLEGANFENANLRDTLFADSNWWRAVGLPSDTIERLKQEFPPTSEAPPGFQEDYAKWLEE